MAGEIDELKDLVTVEEAARKVGMARENFRALARAAGILIPWGKGKKRPRAKVRLADAARAVLSQRQPTARRSSPRSRPSRIPANLPDVSADVTC